MVRSSVPSKGSQTASGSNENGFLAQFSASDEQREWFSPAPPGYQKGRTKYVVVIGTVMSGLGKGIFS